MALKHPEVVKHEQGREQLDPRLSELEGELIFRVPRKREKGMPAGRSFFRGKPLYTIYTSLEEARRRTGQDDIHPGRGDYYFGLGTPVQVYRGLGESVIIGPATFFHGVRGTKSLDFFQKRGWLENFYGGGNFVNVTPNLKEAAGFSWQGESGEFAKGDEIILRLRGPKSQRTGIQHAYRHIGFGDVDEVRVYTDKKGGELEEKRRAYGERYPEHRGKFRFMGIQELRT